MKVFIPQVEEPESLESLRGLAEVRMGKEGVCYSEEDLEREMVDVDVVVITSQQRITRRVIEKAQKLRGIVKYGAMPGADNVDMTAANEKRIPVAYTPGANSDSVAEFTLMLILALAKRLHSVISRAKRHEWRDGTCMGLELGGKTAGIVGYGMIGSKVAKKLSCLNMKVIATDPYVAKEDADLAGTELVSLVALLRESDVVTLHAKVTDETAHMIGKRELALMKHTSYLVNTARGALTDEKALYEALRDREIAGAALDVFETEPPSANNPLLSLDNVILTPHIASWTADALRKEASMAMDEVRRIVTGVRPVNLANPEVLG
jgi:D-3-phosphoglycerate dehydrogenase